MYNVKLGNMEFDLTDVSDLQTLLGYFLSGTHKDEDEEIVRRALAKLD